MNNIVTVFISALAFFGLIFFALSFLFRRIMAKDVVSATAHLEEMSEDYTKKQQEINQLLEEAKQKAQEITAQAQTQAEQLKIKIATQAEGERDRIIAEARTQAGEIIQQADKARNALLVEINERIAHEALRVACDLVYEAIPEHFRRSLQDPWVDDLLAHGFGKLDALKITETISQVRIVSAFPLHEDHRKRLVKAIHESLGKTTPVTEEIDQKVVVGIVIYIGSLVLDGSLRDAIKTKSLSR